MKKTAVYMRVSTSQQKTDSQRDDLERWLSAQGEEIGPVEWYEDHFTGRVMNRPGWNQLQDAMSKGTIKRLVCWRLDRLGRTARGLVTLFDELDKAGIHLVSIKDSVDLSTPAGKLIAHVLASVAAYETEVRGERVKAGQQAARARADAAGRNIKWGGRPKGALNKETTEQIDIIWQLYSQGIAGPKIGKMLGRSKQTIYNVIHAIQDGEITPKPLTPDL